VNDLKLTPNPGLPRRRNTVSGIVPKITQNLKAQRTSKTSQKLVVLPSAPQHERLLSDGEITHGYETDGGIKELKSEAEKMTKEQRKEVSIYAQSYACPSSFDLSLTLL
jgi:hypothetical protein